MSVTKKEMEEIEAKQADEAQKLLKEMNIDKTASDMPHVLIVDDSETQRTMIKKILKPRNINFKEAEDGESALKVLRGDATLNVVFLDISMPNMNGISLLEIINNDPELKNRLKVVMLTAENDAGLVVKAKRFGAKGWIIKPPALMHIEKYLLQFFPKIGNNK